MPMCRTPFIPMLLTLWMASSATLPAFAQDAAAATTQPAADAPATAPTTAPSVVQLPADSPVRGWFADLASPDAAVRDKAQTQLMGMSRQQREGLRLLIARREVTLNLNLTAVLHDI